MRIKKIQLKDYKRFHDLTINLGEDSKKIIALVGPNGCGKSSIFDSFLFKAQSCQPIGNGATRDYIYHHLSGSKSAFGNNNVSITFDEGEYNTLWNKRLQYGTHQTIFSFRSSFRYNGNLQVDAIMAVSDIRQNDVGASSTCDIDQRIEQNYRRLNIKYNDYLNEKDCKPSEAKAYIIGELNSSIGRCLDLIIDNLGNVEANKGTMYFRKKDTVNPFPFDVLSAGEKEVIDILLDLYLRKDIYSDSVYIIDEPELHLNTAIQRQLLKEIDLLIPENCQLWVATHSIGFLRALQEDLKEKSQIIEFSVGNHWASQSYTLEPMTKSRANWKKIFNTALDDLTSLIAPQRIIYCEGKDVPNRNKEEQGLDAIVFNTIFNENYTDTLFVSSGGNTELDQRSDIAIKILSKVFTDMEILILKDRDMASGKPTDETTRQEYLKNNPKSHRVLKRFEIENYLFDKEVLKKYCECEGYNFDDSAYHDFIHDIVNDNVKDSTSRIKKICGITVSVNAEIFKKNLAKCIDRSMQVYKELEDEIFRRK